MRRVGAKEGEERFARFCNGLPPPRRPARFVTCPLDDETDHTQVLGVDEWADGVSAHLSIRDRRAFAATSTHARRLDRDAWRAQRVAILPERVGWHDLWYVAHMPLQEVRAGAEAMDATTDCERNRGLRDVRLCVCVAARLVGAAEAARRPTHLHGVDLWRLATHPHASLFRGSSRATPPCRTSAFRDERVMIASLAALSRNPFVRRAGGARDWRGAPFFLSLERLAAIFHGRRGAAFALEALPWPWLWCELGGMFPWCARDPWTLF